MYVDRLMSGGATSTPDCLIFPIAVAILTCLILPDSTALVGMLMLGNLIKECGVVERLSKTIQNELTNIITIFLGISVGATATASNFLNFQTILIICMGLVAFGISTAGGVLFGKIMYTYSYISGHIEYLSYP